MAQRKHPTKTTAFGFVVVHHALDLTSLDGSPAKPDPSANFWPHSAGEFFSKAVEAVNGVGDAVYARSCGSRTLEQYEYTAPVPAADELRIASSGALATSSKRPCVKRYFPSTSSATD